MSASPVQRLSALDRSFLIYESATAPMHVGAAAVFPAGSLHNAAGGVDLERIEEYVAAQLHRVPRYRQRLAWTPIERHPIWVDDPHFELRYHLRHTRLPRPGSERQLKRAVGRIFSQHLDRHRPLWELWVVEGLEDDRFALVSKTHHCLVDGISGSDLLSTLLSLTPVEKPEPAPAWLPQPPPSGVQLAGDALARALRTPLALARAAWQAARHPRTLGERAAEQLGAVGRMLAGGLGPAPPTPFNQPIGPYRRVDWLATDLELARRTARALGGTVNDVVLATVAGGVRRFLRQRHEDVDRLDFRVMAPVSTRPASERGRLGNRVSAWIVRLPVDERDAKRAFERVHETTSRLKEAHAERAAETLELVSEWTGPLLFELGSRLVNAGAAPFQMVVTNVPGPRAQLFLLDAPLEAVHPLLPLLGTLGVGIALFSYRDVLSWGFTADWDLVPDLHDFVRAIERSFTRLCQAAGTSS